MPAVIQPQTVESGEFIDILDYEFTGDTATLERKRAVVEAYRSKASIYHAAQAAGVHRATIYRWIERDPQFGKALEDSFEDAADIMETSAYEDALGRDGKRGDPILKMFWLKAHRPKFRDKLAVDVPTIQNQVKTFIQELVMQSAAARSTDSINPAALADMPAPKKQTALLTSSNSD